MKILVTGGAGYIGTHTSVVLLKNGYDVIIVDNLCNSKEEAVKRVEKISGKSVAFYKADLTDENKVKKIFSDNKIDAVIHFAGLKAVGESVSKPLEYYDNNLKSTLTLLKVMKEYGCTNIIFSSSATVYGEPESVPIKESAVLPPYCNCPYGTTKLFIERILIDCAKADKNFNPIILRYFNPVGAHESGLIGEDPKGIPNNLMPYIAQTAVGKLDCINVFGNDYPTKDGTGVRDYIHVMDLAEGHVAALKKFQEKQCGLKIYNLGSGVGYSVLEIIHAYEKALGRSLPYKIAARRPGDIPICYADASKANDELGWKTRRSLDDMCRDSLNWQRKNPNGYEQ
jgi:UDP-glucose 4-epimerase